MPIGFPVGIPWQANKRRNLLFGINFGLRLQTHNGDRIPINMFKDIARTQPATLAGDAIASWYDPYSGKAAEQPTLANRPKLQFLSGVPYVVPDGVDDYFSVADAADISLQNDSSVFYTVRNLSAGQIMAKDNAATPGAYNLYIISGTANPNLDRPFIAGGAGTTGPVVFPSVVSIIVNGTAVTFYSDGSPNGSITLPVGTAATGKPLLIFAFNSTTPGSFSPVPISSMLVFNFFMSPANQAKVNSYLAHVK